MKNILIAFTSAIVTLAATMWIVFFMHETPTPAPTPTPVPCESDRPYMKDGCVHHKTPNGWIRTCG